MHVISCEIVSFSQSIIVLLYWVSSLSTRLPMTVQVLVETEKFQELYLCTVACI